MLQKHKSKYLMMKNEGQKRLFKRALPGTRTVNSLEQKGQRGEWK